MENGGGGGGGTAKNNLFSFILVNHLLDINLLHPSTLKECVCLFTVS